MRSYGPDQLPLNLDLPNFSTIDLATLNTNKVYKESLIYFVQI